MNAVAAIMAVFSMIGALDRMIGNRLGLGKEFEKGFMLFGSLALSMIGMIVMSPLIADALQPAMNALWRTLHVDPSLLMASLFANDLGGASLAVETAVEPVLGRFNGLVVSSMMGATISFTIPYALDKVRPVQHESLLLGLLCGVITIPIGCFVGGLVLRVPMAMLLGNMLPLFIISALMAAGLLLVPRLCMKLFGLLGTGIKILITVGLALSILRYLVGIEVIPGLGTLEDAAAIVLNASVVMTGAFPLLAILSRLLKVPLSRLGQKIGINEVSAMGFVSTLAASITTYEMMESMDRKGAILNSAFSVSAAFVFADHLAFTLAFDSSCLPGVIVGKLVAGVCAVILANFVCRFPVSRRT